MNRIVFASLVTTTLLLLASCGNTSKPPEPNPITPTVQPASPTETRDALTSVATTANSLAGDFQREIQQLLTDLGVSSVPASVMSSFSLIGAAVPSHDVLTSGKVNSQSITGLTEAVVQQEFISMLPRGIYTNNARGTNLVKTGESDDYIETRQTAQGVLRFYADWDASSIGTASPTVFLHSVFNGQAQTNYQSENPTKAVFTITLGNTTLASANLALAFRPSTCLSGKFLSEPPLSVQASGYVARQNGQKAVEATASYLISGRNAQTSGEIKTVSNTNQASVKWNVSGTLTRVEGACGSSISLGFGSDDTVNFSSELKVNEKGMALSFKADQFPTASTQPTQVSIRLKDGQFVVDNKKVTFEGTLDDANQNCIPGDNITLTFSSGSTNLEAFLVSQYNLQPCRR